MKEADKHDVLISYKRGNENPDKGPLTKPEGKDFIDKINRIFRLLDVTYWIDRENMPSGKPWADALSEKLEEVSAVLCVIGNGFLKSSVCRREFSDAIVTNKCVIVHIHSDMNIVDNNLYKHHHGLPVFNWNGKVDTVEGRSILEALSEHLQRPLKDLAILLERFEDDPDHNRAELESWIQKNENDPTSRRLLKKFFKQEHTERYKEAVAADSALNVWAKQVKSERDSDVKDVLRYLDDIETQQENPNWNDLQELRSLKRFDPDANARYVSSQDVEDYERQIKSLTEKNNSILSEKNGLKIKNDELQHNFENLKGELETSRAKIQRYKNDLKKLKDQSSVNANEALIDRMKTALDGHHAFIDLLVTHHDQAEEAEEASRNAQQLASRADKWLVDAVNNQSAQEENVKGAMIRFIEHPEASERVIGVIQTQTYRYLGELGTQGSLLFPMGLGVLTLSNRNEMRGNFEKYELHGPGEIKLANGVSWRGLWVMSAPIKGRLEDLEFRPYFGEVKMAPDGVNIIKNGRGVINQRDGVKAGDWENNRLIRGL